LGEKGGVVFAYQYLRTFYHLCAITRQISRRSLNSTTSKGYFHVPSVSIENAVTSRVCFKYHRNRGLYIRMTYIIHVRPFSDRHRCMAIAAILIQNVIYFRSQYFYLRHLYTHVRAKLVKIGQFLPTRWRNHILENQDGGGGRTVWDFSCNYPSGFEICQ
jgi:hypothetical protein